MPGNAAVKHTAKVFLSKNWPSLIAVSFLLLAVMFIGVYAAGAIFALTGMSAAWFTTLFTIVYNWFLLFPLMLGVLKFAWRIVSENDATLDSVFYYFSSAAEFFRAIKFSLSMVIRVVFCAVISFFPAVATEVSIAYFGDFANGSAQMHLMFLSTVLAFCGIALFIVLSSRYYIAPFLFAGTNKLGTEEIFHLSKIISRHTAGAFIVLIIGMLGWILLSVFGISLVYTMPYMLLAYTVHCRYAVYFHNHRAKLSSETEFFEYRSNF